MMTLLQLYQSLDRDNHSMMLGTRLACLQRTLLAWVVLIAWGGSRCTAQNIIYQNSYPVTTSYPNSYPTSYPSTIRRRRLTPTHGSSTTVRLIASTQDPVCEVTTSLVFQSRNSLNSPRPVSD